LPEAPPRLAADPSAVEIVCQRANRAELEIAREDDPDRLRLGWDHHDLLIHCRVAKRDRPPDPNALALGGGNLVPHPLPNQLPFELGKRQQDIEREPAHAGAGVEGLRDRHERHVMGIEQLNDLGEISERAGEPIDLVNQHNVDRPRPDIGQELPHGRTLERGAGECTIVVAVREQALAFVRLTLYICLAGLALGIERGKGKVEVMLGGFAGIDGAAQELMVGNLRAARLQADLG